MRKSLIVGAMAAVLAASAAAFAGARARAPAVTAGPPVIAPPGDSTAYEQAVTAYLDNVVNKARRKAAQNGHIDSPPQRPARIAGPRGYPGRRAPPRVLPRVERITIGLSRQAVLATPNGGRLRVSPGVMTPYGRVTAIRAAGVWFLARGAHGAVQLGDVSAHARRRGGLVQGMAPREAQLMNVPPPPNLQRGGQR